MFKDLKPLKPIYRTSVDDIGKDFFVPILKESVSYDRGVGYFTLESLSLLAEGIIPLLKKGGTIRVLTSVQLNEKDVQTILTGERLTEKILTQKLEAVLDSKLSDYTREQKLNLDLITNLIAAARLQIQVAYIETGLYHEKIAIMRDQEDNVVFAIGSNNETYNGLLANVESLSVMCSWGPCSFPSAIKEQVDYFESIWNGKDSQIKVFKLPEALEQKLIQTYRVSQSVDEAITAIINPEGNVKDDFAPEYELSRGKTLYPYQAQAIEEFWKRRGSHFYEMATGTGKTFTAIKTIQHTFSKIKKTLYVAVVVPQIDLQVQWQKAFEAEGINCILFGGVNTNIQNDLLDSILDYKNKECELIVTISVYQTFFRHVQPQLFEENIGRIFLVVDEAHELSPMQQSALFEKNYILRLGLSATPERQNREESKAILNYFTKGQESFKYTIDDAIENGFLSHYQYYPLFVTLTEEEFEEFRVKTIQLSQLINSLKSTKEDKKKVELKEKIEKIAMDRSVIVKKARNKLALLNEMVKTKDYNFRNAVVYCGAGKAIEGFGNEYEVEPDSQLINQVISVLSKESGLVISSYTSKTQNRIEVLKRFEDGYFDTLVAIRCFDQGVDVPKLDKIYIMSSDELNRQTIQRRGRVLRKCKESGKEIAYIYDMVVLPPDVLDESVKSAQRALLSKEMKRLNEYARLADNQEDVRKMVEDVLANYDFYLEVQDEF